MSNQGTLKKNSGDMEDIDREAQKLLKRNLDNKKSSESLLAELRSKYKDEEVVEAIRSKFQEKFKKVKRLAEKISEKLVSKYPNMSIKEYIQKVSEYKKKYNFDDSEMQSILQIIFKNKNTIDNSEILEIGQNQMGKTLGFQMSTYNYGGKMEVRPDEMEQLQAILAIHAGTRELHNQITLQSLIYEDVTPAAINGTFKKEKVNIFSFVHPVVAALFLPKIKFLDEHMLLGSIANIVAKRYEGSHLDNQPDYELYIDIATDPSEVACNVDSNYLMTGKAKPLTDLLARVNVQTKLWESVIQLRQGKYYTNDLSSFIMAIDTCRNSIFDAADLAYVKDEGTILRKLFSAFSIRPTIVSTAPIYGLSTVASSPLASLAATHITTIPMITFRIPLIESKANPQVFSLTDCLEQRQLYIHKRQITVKTQQIMYSRDVLIFYVHRRFQTINLAKLSRPYQMASLPVTIGAYERLHPAQVNFELSLTVGNQRFDLKSVVAVETAPNDPNLILGCSALIRVNNEFVNKLGAIKYNPLDLQSNLPDDVKPLSWCDLSNISNDPNVCNFYSIASLKGTLFIYKACGETNKNSFNFFEF
jgi:hypothetical protein